MRMRRYAYAPCKKLPYRYFSFIRDMQDRVGPTPRAGTPRSGTYSPAAEVLLRESFSRVKRVLSRLSHREFALADVFAEKNIDATEPATATIQLVTTIRLEYL